MAKAQAHDALRVVVGPDGENCDKATIANIAQNKQFYLQASNHTGWLINSTSVNVGGEIYIDSEDHELFLRNWAKIVSFSNYSFGLNRVTVAQILYLNTNNISDSWFSSNQYSQPSDYLSHVRAVEAMFYICAETYNVTTTNGSTQTVITATANNITDFNYPTATYTVDSLNYTLDILRGLTMFLDDMLSGIFKGTFSEYSFNLYEGKDGVDPFTYALGHALYPNYHKAEGTYHVLDDQAMFHAVELLLGNMAREMTNWYVIPGFYI